MRIVLACPYAWDAPGGVQVHVRGLANALARRGHEPLILAPANGDVDEDDVRVVGRPVRIPYGGKVAPICPSRSSWRRVREALRVFEPAVVHVHEPFSPSTSMFATLASEVPVVATFHAFHERSRLLRVSAPVLRSVADRISAPVAVSEAAAAFVAGVVAAEIEIVPNGVDVARFSAATEPAPDIPPPPVMLWASRLDRQKGFRLAIRAFAELADSFEDLSFVVVGEGSDRDATEALARGVRARVRMVGAVPNRELHRYHAGASVFVAPATGHESFGVILVEAMAAGVPVVASDIPGYREVVRAGLDGLLVPPGDPHLMAEAVGQILRDPELARGLRAAGRERAATFSWDAVAPRLEAIYARLTAPRDLV
jgi:phosphatidyl-myo-inositol alpha-mannosyltransferase